MSAQKSKSKPSVAAKAKPVAQPKTKKAAAAPAKPAAKVAVKAAVKPKVKPAVKPAAKATLTRIVSANAAAAPAPAYAPPAAPPPRSTHRFVKVARKNVRKIFSKALKPAECRPDPSDPDNAELFKFFAVFVDPNANQQTIPCTAEDYVRINNPGASLSEPYRGIDMTTNRHFFVNIDKTTGAFAGLDIIPIVHYDHSKHLKREDLENVKLVSVQINGNTGECRILAAPARTPTNTLMSLVASIDKVAELHSGQVLDGSFNVVSVHGDVVEIALREQAAKGVAAYN